MKPSGCLVEADVAQRCIHEVNVQDLIRTQLSLRDINADLHFVLTSSQRSTTMTLPTYWDPCLSGGQALGVNQDPFQPVIWRALNVHIAIYPFCEGGDVNSTLGVYRRRPKMPLDQAVRCFIQTAESLQLLHELNHLHRDIKPANIMIKNGRYLIGDWTTSSEIGRGSQWIIDRTLDRPSPDLALISAQDASMSSSSILLSLPLPVPSPSTPPRSSLPDSVNHPSTSSASTPSTSILPNSAENAPAGVYFSPPTLAMPTRAVKESLYTDWSCWAQLMLQMLLDISDTDYMDTRKQWGGKTYREVCDALRNAAKPYPGLENLVDACLAPESSSDTRIHSILHDRIVATWRVLLGLSDNAPEHPALDSVLFFVAFQAETSPHLYARLFHVLRYIVTSNKQELLHFVGNLEAWRVILSLAAKLLAEQNTAGCRDALFVLAYYMAELERNQLYKELRQVQIVAMDTPIGELLPKLIATEAIAPATMRKDTIEPEPTRMDEERQGETASTLNSSLHVFRDASPTESLSSSFASSLTIGYSTQSLYSSFNDGSASQEIPLPSSRAPQYAPFHPPLTYVTLPLYTTRADVSSSSIAVTITALLCVRNDYWASKFFNGERLAIADYIKRASEVNGLFPDLTCIIIASILDERYLNGTPTELLSAQELEPITQIFQFLSLDASFRENPLRYATLIDDLSRLIAFDVLHMRTAACRILRIPRTLEQRLRNPKSSTSLSTLLSGNILPRFAAMMATPSIFSFLETNILGYNWKRAEATIRLAIPRLFASPFISYNLSVRDVCHSPAAHPTQPGLDLGVTSLLQDVMKIHASPLCECTPMPQGTTNPVIGHRCLRCAIRALKLCPTCKKSNMELIEFWSAPSGPFECPGDAEDAENETASNTPQLVTHESEETVTVLESARYCQYFVQRFSAHLLPPQNHLLVGHRSPPLQPESTKGLIENSQKRGILVVKLAKSPPSPTLRSSAAIDAPLAHGPLQPSLSQSQLKKLQKEAEVKNILLPSEGTLGEYAEVTLSKMRGALPREAWIVVIPTANESRTNIYDINMLDDDDEANNLLWPDDIRVPFIGFCLTTGEAVYYTSNGRVQRIPYGPRIDYRNSVGLGVTVHGDVFAVTTRGVLPLLNQTSLPNLHPTLMSLDPIAANYNMAVVMTPLSRVRVNAENKLLSLPVLTKRASGCPLHHIASATVSAQASSLLTRCGPAGDFLLSHLTAPHSASSMSSLLSRSMASLPRSPPQQQPTRRQDPANLPE